MQLIKESQLAFVPLIFPDIQIMAKSNSLLTDVDSEKTDIKPIREQILETSQKTLFDLEEVEKQAKEIIEKAKLESEQIINQAQKQAKEIEKTTREQALNQARIEANVELTQAMEILNKDINKSLEELSFLGQQIAAHMEEDLLKLSIEIAKKVVHREITTDREVIISLVQVALARLHNRTVAYIRLNPMDYQYLVSNSERIATGKTIELSSDPTITRGGCIIETEFGNVDARIEQQFVEIERSLL
ncbi:MAG: FliH/SctL family protein [Blastocatellia bacterium]